MSRSNIITTREPPEKTFFTDYLLSGLIIFILGSIMIFYRLEEIPPLTFDEGWSLQVAKNWVTTGHYARLLQGDPISAVAIAKPFSVTGPIGLIFLLFGVGVWQARLSAVISMILALYLIFQLARNLFGIKKAYLTLTVLVSMAPLTIHPLIVGREAIAESPMLFYLIGGYLLFLYSLYGNKLATFGTVLLWGFALDSKGHALLFWSASLSLTMVVIILRKHWQTLKIYITVLIGSLLVYLVLTVIQKSLFSSYPFYGNPVEGFYSLGVFVTSPEVRLITLKNVLFYGIPTLVGIFFSSSKTWHEYQTTGSSQPEFYLRLSLLFLVITWFLWFVLLSLGWSRYFYPIWFMSSFFIAHFLWDYLSKIPQLISGTYKKDTFTRIKIYFVVFLVILVVSINFLGLYVQIGQGNDDACQVADYIKQNLRSNDLVETYESELLFLADNPFHYPPDQVQVDYNKKTFLKQEVSNPYNPSAIEFKYLVIGPFGELWDLYTPLLNQGSFQEVYQAGQYHVYKRNP